MYVKLRMTGFSRKLRMLNCGYCVGRVVVCGGVCMIFRGRGGLVSTRPNVIRNSEGMLCSTLAESVQRWQEHFDHVLNTQGSDNKLTSILWIL